MSNLSPNEFTRRRCLETAAKGLAIAPASGVLLSNAVAQQRVPEPPGKKLGYALVGLGSLSINQILPAFAKCEKSKVTALVSGDPAKANKLAGDNRQQ